MGSSYDKYETITGKGKYWIEGRKSSSFSLANVIKLIDRVYLIDSRQGQDFSLSLLHSFQTSFEAHLVS
jgi:hypothetical protein